MMQLQLITKIDERFARSKSGAIWGHVCFLLPDGEVVPDPSWTDLVIAFEADWLGSILSIAQGHTVSAEVPFYDGPFSVRASGTQEGDVALRFARGDVAISVVRGSLVDLLTNAFAVGTQLMAGCVERQWVNADTERLGMLLKHARPYLESN